MQISISSLTGSLYLVWKICLLILDAMLKILMIGRNCFVLKLRLLKKRAILIMQWGYTALLNFLWTLPTPIGRCFLKSICVFFTNPKRKKILNGFWCLLEIIICMVLG